MNIRSGPGADYEVIGKMQSNETVVIDRVGIRWHRIAFGDGMGYITADAVSLDAGLAMTPVIDVVLDQENKLPAGCSQVILSLVNGTTGWVWVLEKQDGQWQGVLGPFDANMGRKGPGKEKAGDEKTPLGVFIPDLAFGTGDAPEGVVFPWRAITSDSLWVGDSESRYYNLWVENGTVTKDYDLSDCERLSSIMPQYELALNYGYNPECTPYAGSALFLHVWRAKGVGTAGCTAVSRDAMLDILQRLDPGKSPAFVQLVLPSDDGE